MERICDNVLGLILKRVSISNDRKSCSEVCKRWYKVEGLTRSSVLVLDRSTLHSFLPRFPNLVTFSVLGGITDSDLRVLAETCPDLHILNLNFSVNGYDIGDDGVCAVAISCCKLREVSFRDRIGVGDVGVITLVRSNPHLVSLDLGRVGITDQALEAIATTANSLQNLILWDCFKITDLGLSALGKGTVSKTLKKLLLIGCQITDNGVLDLQQMHCLEELDISHCGLGVTDTGGVAISSIRTLKVLDLSWLRNITDVTLIAISQNCSSLESLNVNGCNITGSNGAGIRSFANHASMQNLALLEFQSGRVRYVNACMLPFFT